MTRLLLEELSPANGQALVVGAGGGLELKALAEQHPDVDRHAGTCERNESNFRPHSSLGYKTPADYAGIITATGSKATRCGSFAFPPVLPPRQLAYQK
jgi:hypothetical protein